MVVLVNSLSLILFPWTVMLRKLQIPNATSKSPPWRDCCVWLPSPLLSSVLISWFQYSKPNHSATCLPTTSVLPCSLSPSMASICLLKFRSTFASSLQLPPSSPSLAMCAFIAHFDGVLIIYNTLSLFYDSYKWAIWRCSSGPLEKILQVRL